MDRLTAFVAISHVKLRIKLLERHPEILEAIEMTPNFKGFGAALAKFKHDLDMQSVDAMNEMSSLGSRASVAMSKVKAKVAETKAAVEEIEAFVADEGSNGGPTLSDSSDTSAAQSQPVAVEHLTVNGVSTNV